MAAKEIAKQMYDQGKPLTTINRYLLNEGKCSIQQAIQIIKEITKDKNDLLQHKS